MQVDAALDSLDRLQRVSATPSLARASANLALARVSAVSLRRTSLTATPAGELEANMAELEQVVGDMQQAADDAWGDGGDNADEGDGDSDAAMQQRAQQMAAQAGRPMKHFDRYECLPAAFSPELSVVQQRSHKMQGIKARASVSGGGMRRSDQKSQLLKQMESKRESESDERATDPMWAVPKSAIYEARCLCQMPGELNACALRCRGALRSSARRCWCRTRWSTHQTLYTLAISSFALTASNQVELEKQRWRAQRNRKAIKQAQSLRQSYAQGSCLSAW